MEPQEDQTRIYYVYIVVTKLMYIVFLFHLVNCEWGNWSLGQCSAKCGGGIQIDSRVQSQEALFDGNPCEGEATRKTVCNPNACPGKILFMNCVYNSTRLSKILLILYTHSYLS